jgi:hypothetical protein
MKIEDMDMIIQAIESRLHKIGRKFAIRPYMIDNNCSKFHLEIIQNQAQDSNDTEIIIVTRNSHDLSLIFSEEDSFGNSHKKFKSLDELLNFIDAHFSDRKKCISEECYEHEK